jgi:predicted permease
MLVIAAGLMVRSVRNLNRVELGFDQNNVLLFWMYPTTLGYDGPTEIRLYQRLLERFRGIHGVVEASMARHNLMQGAGNFFLVSGNKAAVNTIAPGFFQAMRIPLLAGRDFSFQDESGSAKVAIVDQRFAADRFAGQEPIGKTIEIQHDVYQIVGVVRNVRYFSLRQESSVPSAEVFLPFTQVPRNMVGQMNFALRTAGDPMKLLPEVRREAQAVEKNLPLVFVTTQAMAAQESIGEERSLAILTAIFGGAAMLLACLGLYGVIAFTTARRTNEIGLRMALGATRGDVIRIVLNDSARLVVTGIVIGVPAALSATRLIATWLFGVGSSDPLTIAGAASVMIAVSVLAGFIPARKAARVDPVVALRHE